MKPIYIAADHAGFKLKELLKVQLAKNKIAFVDLGNSVYEKNDDYPDFGYVLAKKVAKEKGIGVLMCGSSFGVCIVANKVKGIRAVSISNVRDAKLSREHNNANVLCLSGWNLSSQNAMKIVNAFLTTKFSTEARHRRRVKKIEG